MQYNYKCETHGPFAFECKITEYRDRVECPVCKQLCSRDFSEYKDNNMSIHLSNGMYGIDGGKGWNS